MLNVLFAANTAVMRMMQNTVKQPGKFAGFSKKERQNLPAVFSILFLLIYLLTYLTGKADAESVQNWKLFYKHSL